MTLTLPFHYRGTCVHCRKARVWRLTQRPGEGAIIKSRGVATVKPFDLEGDSGEFTVEAGDRYGFRFDILSTNDGFSKLNVNFTIPMQRNIDGQGSGEIAKLSFENRRSQIGRQGHEATVQVLPDYLAIGDDRDFVCVPLSPLAAQRIADRLGFALPTRKLVDDVYASADVKLAPRPMPAGARMMSVDYFARHQQTVEGQLAGTPRGHLVAGHKKAARIFLRLPSGPVQTCLSRLTVCRTLRAWRPRAAHGMPGAYFRLSWHERARPS